MGNTGAVTLSDLTGRFQWLDIVCERCSRHGRYRITRFLKQHGDIGLPDLRRVLASDCPRLQAVSIYTRCEARFVDLRD